MKKIQNSKVVAPTVISEKIGSEALNTLNEFSRCIVVRTQEELEHIPVNVQKDVQAVINRKLLLPDRMIENMPLLKVVARTGVGFDRSRVNAELLRQRGIWLTTNPGNNSRAVSEFTIGLIISLLRKIHTANLSVKSGNWDASSFIGNEVAEKTIGIIGFGNVGKRVCKAALSLEMKVVAYDSLVSPSDIERQGARFMEIDNLVMTSDIITLHLPLSDQTRNILSVNRLEKMKKNAIIINTSRGGLIDESALYNLIRVGAIAGCALDVLEKEPIDRSNPLVQLQNVIVTPHIAGSTAEAYRKGATMAVDEVRRVLSGNRPLNPVYETKKEGS